MRGESVADAGLGDDLLQFLGGPLKLAATR